MYIVQSVSLVEHETYHAIANDSFNDAMTVLRLRVVAGDGDTAYDHTLTHEMVKIVGQRFCNLVQAARKAAAQFAIAIVDERLRSRFAVAFAAAAGLNRPKLLAAELLMYDALQDVVAAAADAKSAADLQ